MAHILFVDSNLPGIQTLARAKALGHRVTLIRSTGYAMYAATAKNQGVLASLDYVVDMDTTSNVARVLDVAVDLHKRTPFDAVLTQLEYSVEAAAAVAERLGLPFMNPTAVRNARCKEQARRLLDEAEVASARYALVHSVEDGQAAAQRIGLPVVVKPSSGADSILAARCDSIDEVCAALSTILETREHLPEQMREQFSRGILVEEHLAGPLVSAEIALRDGKVTNYMICGRVRGQRDETIELGAAMPAEISGQQQQECFEYAQTVCRALGIDFGFVHIEMILTTRGPVMVETNPRLMGGIMPALYRVATGRSILDDLLALHVGEPLTPPSPAIRHCTTRKIMLAGEATLASVIEAADLHAATHGLDIFDAPGMVAGARLARHSIVGRLVASADSMPLADEIAGKALHDLSELLGVELVQ